MRSAGAEANVEDDDELVRRSLAGELGAFATLLDRHDRGLRALAYRLLGDRDQMDDVLQETYLKAFRSLPAFEGRSSFGAWLYRIAYNACMDELREVKRTSPHVSLDIATERPHPSPDPGEIAAGRSDLATALGSLSPQMRATVLLVDAEGMDYASAAQILGVPTGTVRSRLNRARSILRQALGQGAEGGE